MTAAAGTMKYKVFGNDMQFVELELSPGETVIAEAGAMMYMDAGIQMETKLGDGSDPSQGLLKQLWSAASRVMMAESLFLTHFTNRGAASTRMAFAAPYPGKIIPCDLSARGGMLAQKGAFLCAPLGTSLSIAFTKRFGAGLFGGEGFILERVAGTGRALIHAGGGIAMRELRAGETMRVDAGCIVAFEEQIDYDIQFVGGIVNSLFGGEGVFLATLTGPGKVMLQSLPFSRLADRMIAAAGWHRKEEGSLLGRFGDAFSGDRG
jgi:uncharacterized protein (TIGR00266 family)